MTKKVFFASCAKTVFTIAAVVMMSTAFISCSKDNNDEPVPQLGTVTLDGKEKPILKARYLRISTVATIILYLSEDGKERIEMVVLTDEHINTKPIPLGDYKTEERNRITIEYRNKHNKEVFTAYAPKRFEGRTFFTAGTLSMTGSLGAEMNIMLKAGNVKVDRDNYTLEINFNGILPEMTEKD